MYVIVILFIVNLAKITVKCDEKTIHNTKNSITLQKRRQVIDNTDSLNPAQNPLFNIVKHVNHPKTKREDTTQIEPLDLFRKAPYNDNSQSTSQEKLVKEKVRATKQFKISFAPSFISKEYHKQGETQANSTENSTATKGDKTKNLPPEDTKTSDTSSVQEDEDNYQKKTQYNVAGSHYNNEEPDSSFSEDTDIIKEKEDEYNSKNIKTFKKTTNLKNSKKMNINSIKPFKIIKELNKILQSEENKHDSEDDSVTIRKEILKYVKYLMNKNKGKRDHKHQYRYLRKKSKSKPLKQENKIISRKSVNNSISNHVISVKKLSNKSKTIKQRNNKLHETKSIAKKTINTYNKIVQKDDNLVQKIKKNLTPLIKALINEERKTEIKVDLPSTSETKRETEKDTFNENTQNEDLQHYSDIEKVSDLPNIFDALNENEVDFQNPQIREILPDFQQTNTDDQDINNYNENDENLLQVPNNQQTGNDDNDDLNVDGLEKYDDESPMGVILPSIVDDDDEVSSTSATAVEHNSTTKKEQGKFHKFIGKIRKGLREKINKILGGT